MKQPLTIPEVLTDLDDDALSALGNDIRAAAEELGPDAQNDDASLAELIRLGKEFDRVNEELNGREAQRAARAEQAAAALTKITGGGDDDAITDDLAPEAEVTEPVAEALPVAAATEDEAPIETEAVVEKATDDAEVLAPDAPSEASADEDTTSEATAEDVTEASAEDTATLATAEDATTEATAEADTATTEDAVTTSTTQPTAVESLDAARPDAISPVSTGGSTAAVLAASNAVPGFTEGTVLDSKALALAVTKKRHGLNPISTGSSERIVLATATTDLPYALVGGAEENFGILAAATQEWKNSRRAATRALATATPEAIPSLVASGGVCAPLEPNYEFFRLATPLNPVESALPVAEAPRGGIRFIAPPDWTDASGGVRVTTEAQDAAGYPPTAVKPCVSVECPDVEECRVDAVSQCVTFGNLNYRVFPEQVEAFLADLAVVFTQTKEVFYLDAIDNASTAVTFTPAYSASRGLTYTLLASGANYRRRHHMAPDAVLTLLLPSWISDFLKADLVADHALGMNFLGASDAQVAQVFAGMNLDVSFYYDSATGAGQGFADVQSAGEMNVFPGTVVGYLFAPGTFVRLNGGTLDVGLVRDSVLNGTNDLQLFSEEWIQVCQVGLESLRLEITLCPDGTGPEPVTPMDCAALLSA